MRRPSAKAQTALTPQQARAAAALLRHSPAAGGGGQSLNSCGRLRLRVLQLRLFYEQLRLGSDSASLYLRRIAPAYAADSAPLTIGQMRRLLASLVKMR